MKYISGYAGLLKLVGLLLLLPLVVYAAGIKRTIDLNRTVKEQVVRIETARVDTVQKTEIPVDIVVRTEADGSGVKSGAILYRAAPLLEQNGVATERYTPYLLYRTSDIELYAGELLLSGGFIPLVCLLDEWEKQKEEGQIVSAGFRTVVHPQSRKKQLQMTVVFQQATQTESL
jgi:hypothetical protein